MSDRKFLSILFSAIGISVLVVIALALVAHP
jgi:hypothetical protein